MKDEHRQNIDHCVTLTNRHLVFNCYYWTASSVSLMFKTFFDKFCWALSTKFANFNQGTLVLFYSLLSCCVGTKTTWFNMFYCSVFNRNWRHDWEQVPSCLQSHKLHDTTTSYAVPHVIGPCSCPSAAITTVLPICKKTTNPPITEKAKSPYILQA